MSVLLRTLREGTTSSDGSKAPLETRKLTSSSFTEVIVSKSVDDGVDGCVNAGKKTGDVQE